MKAQEISSIEVGSTVPDFHLPGSAGKVVDVRDFRDRSNLVLFFVREFN
jgi:peroxiredoxin